MEQFNALPLPQKLLALVVAMAALGGLFWYAMIMPLSEVAADKEKKEQQARAALETAKKEAAGPKQEEIAERKKALEAEKAKFENMLPRREELVKFISGLSETAKNSGLQILSFQKEPPREQDYYVEIPINMEVRGSYRELVAFFRSISEKDWRVVNVRDLAVDMEELDPGKLVSDYQKRRQDELPPGVTARQLTPAQNLRDIVRATEEVISRGVELKASFVAYVFTYTGRPAAPQAAERSRSRKEARRKRRQRSLVIL